MLSHLHIEYVNPSTPTDIWAVDYRLRDNPIVPRWTAKVQQAQTHYEIDDPGRFYGFGSYESQVADALARINQCIVLPVVCDAHSFKYFSVSAKELEAF